MSQGAGSLSSGATLGVALAIGNFDGVHRGHQALVRYTLELAQRHGLRAKVMTFDPHPAQVLNGRSPAVLTRLSRKLRLLRGLADDLEVIVQPFTREFSRLTPRQFVEHILVDLVQVRQLVVGTNFHFGCDRSGNYLTLQQLGGKFGFEAHGFALSGDVDGSFSSSRIRRWIADGDVSQAGHLLGRPHAITGTVVHGDGRGASFGFATANLNNVDEQVPPAGVYAGIAQLGDERAQGSCYPAAIHVGPRPTVDRGATIEAHLLDYQGNLYGRDIELHFIERLRGLSHFESVTALTQQIAADVVATRQATSGVLLGWARS